MNPTLRPSGEWERSRHVIHRSGVTVRFVGARPRDPTRTFPTPRLFGAFTPLSPAPTAHEGHERRRGELADASEGERGRGRRGTGARCGPDARWVARADARGAVRRRVVGRRTGVGSGRSGLADGGRAVGRPGLPAGARGARSAADAGHRRHRQGPVARVAARRPGVAQHDHSGESRGRQHPGRVPGPVRAHRARPRGPASSPPRCPRSCSGTTTGSSTTSTPARSWTTVY